MNVQLMWHLTEGKTLIKAGTPISQYILVPKEDFDMEIKTMGQEATIHDIFELSDGQRFIKNYNDVRNLFGKD
jgi:hypothetical protein